MYIKIPPKLDVTVNLQSSMICNALLFEEQRFHVTFIDLRINMFSYAKKAYSTNIDALFYY